MILKAYFGKIEEITLKNTYFRQVLYTAKHSQLVVMSLKPGEEIGNEVHENVDQFFRVESGSLKFVVNDREEEVEAIDGDSVIIPAGSWHNVINTSEDKDAKLYTVYSPPNHPDGTIHKTKEEAIEAEEKEHQ